MYHFYHWSRKISHTLNRFSTHGTILLLCPDAQRLTAVGGENGSSIGQQESRVHSFFFFNNEKRRL